MNFDKCIVTCIPHYSIIQDNFTSLKTLCSTHLSLSLPNPNCKSPDPFTVSIDLPSNGAARVAQGFSTAFSPGPDPGVPGSSHVPHRAPGMEPVSACVCLPPLSVSVSLMNT
ncbi:hypothetical protein VULLAG_LOCUS14661 [Vulpes lagopus]